MSDDDSPKIGHGAPPLGEMDPAAFRETGHRLVEWIADYLEHSDRHPVLSRSRPGDIRRALPSAAPDSGEGFAQILEDVDRIILPGVTHWNHPGFFAYFAISGSGPGVLADFLSAALNAQGMLWRTSPALTELEEVMLDWLRQLLGLAPVEGVIYDTASGSTRHALAAARQHVVPDSRGKGLAGRPNLGPLRVYCSQHAHSSVDKALIMLGLGHDNLRRVDTDEHHRMRTDALQAAITEDRASGMTPMAVVATVGTTAMTSVDPVPAVVELCEREDLWLHVDAAYAGAAAMVPGFEDTLAGCDQASSLVVNPHKWLFTPFDLSVLYCRKMDVLRTAFSLTPDYLENREAGSVRNLMDTGVQLGRRFRALKLWMVLRHFGANGLRGRLADHIRLARLFGSWVDESSQFERLAPIPFSVVCFRIVPDPDEDDEAVDRLNAELLDAVNRSGEVFLSHTTIKGRYTLRLAVGHIRTTEAHVTLAWNVLKRELGRLRAGG